MGVKKRFLIILLIMFFVSLAAVSASEDNETDVISVDMQDNNASVSTVEVDSVEKSIDSDVQSQEEIDENNADQSKNNVKLAGANDNGEVLGASADNEVLSAGEYSFTSLQNAITRASSGGIITIDNDVIYQSTDSVPEKGLLINKRLTIEGDGKLITIDARKATKIFNIDTSSQVTFRNIIFKNAVSNAENGGGAIFSKVSANLIFNNCVFDSNSHSSKGGAVYLEKGQATFTDCNFTNNHAGGGGAICIMSTGAYENLNIENCYFRNNNATSTSSVGSGGGAIYVQYIIKVQLKNSVFEENHATLNGGVIIFDHAQLDSSTFDVINCNFTRNEAQSGGSIKYSYTTNKMTINGCIFKDNYVSNTGADIQIPSGSNVVHTISNSQFLNSNSTGSGGSIYFSADKLIINNCLFNKTTGNNGGSIFLASNAKTLQVSNSNFTNVEVSTTGGVIYSTSASLQVENSIFKDTHAGRRAGAIFFENGVNGITIINSIFTNNTAVNEGGSIIIASGSKNILIQESNFTNNAAANEGGAILLFANVKDMNVTDSYFENNNASEGGAIYFTTGTGNSNINIDKSTFTKNTAKTGLGGAIALNCVNGTVQ